MPDGYARPPPRTSASSSGPGFSQTSIHANIGASIEKLPTTLSAAPSPSYRRYRAWHGAARPSQEIAARTPRAATRLTPISDPGTRENASAAALVLMKFRRFIDEL
jgi:hypothetical protein